MHRAAVVLLSLLGLATGTAIIGNGVVILGVDDLGQLNIPYKAVAFSAGGVPLPNTDPVGVRVIGLRYDEYPFPPSTEPGCVCEGWGVKYVTGGTTYKAGVDNALGIFGASLVSFTGTDGGNTATSVVSVSGGAKVTHLFKPSLNSQIYRVIITIENPSTVPYTSFIYRRQMDWDIYPTVFNEYVTIRGAAGHPKLVSSCDDGFVGGDIDRRSCISAPGYNQNYEDNGPRDHGAYFDFEVGPIAAKGKTTFTMYYGVGQTYASVDAAINSLPLEVLSYGKSNCGGPCNSKWTFAWGFSGTGGDTITRPPFTVVAPDDFTVQCGTTYALEEPEYFGNCDDEPLKSLTLSTKTTPGSCTGTSVISRNFTGIDRCDRVSTDTQVISIIDTVAPVITAPASATYECGTTPSVAVTARDACAGTISSVPFTDTATTAATCVGRGITRTFSARDNCMNTATATTTLTAVDTTKPTLVIPADIEVDCSKDSSPAATGTATATDTCSTATVTYSDTTSGSGCPRTISRTWYATDACGNRASGVQKITVRPFCGDGLVQGAEECDLGANNGVGGYCCSSTCTLAPTSLVCRASAGSCDIVEYCTGSSPICPGDTYKAAGTPCGELFGMCDVAVEKSCTGLSPRCGGPPAFPAFPESNASWVDYTVISFDQFQCTGGDVEGRLAVKNKATLSAFTLGLELRLATDSWRRHSLFVARDASWTDGSLHPDGTNVGASGPPAYAFVGRTASFAPYLASRLDSSPAVTSDSAANSFDTLKVYYSQIQKQLSAIPTNVIASVQYTNGLLLTCSETVDLYHVTVSATTFSSTVWTETRNCKFGASWIIDITGNEPVTIQGQPFPGIVERVIYNVLGTNTITGATGIAGHILAPNSNFEMQTGVTYGTLVAGNVTFSRQNNRPNCLVFAPVTLATKTLKPVKIGDSTVWVVSLSSFIAGDRVCINGDCKKVIAGETRDIDGDGKLDHGVVVDTVYAVEHSDGSFASTVVSDPANADRSAPLTEVSATEENNQKPNSAAVFGLSMVGVLALSALL